MKKLLVFLLLAGTAAVAQVPVDGYMNLYITSPQAPTTQLSSTILSNGQLGTGWNGWGTATGTASALTVGSAIPGCELMTTISVGGVTVTPAQPAQSFSLNTNSNFSYFSPGITGSHQRVSKTACLFSTVPGKSNSQVYDLWNLQDSGGHFVILQFVDGLGANYGLRLHTDGNGSLVSSLIPWAPNTPIVCSMLSDETGSGVPPGGSPTLIDVPGTGARLACWNNFPPYATVGNPQWLQQQVGRNITADRNGNAEIGTANGVVKWQHMMVDTTNAAWPLAPGTLATPWAGIISPLRAVDWSLAGATIDPRTTICATLDSTVTTAAAQTAINNCPVGQAVFLNPGSYSFTGGQLPKGKAGVTVRGSGDATILLPTTTSSCSAVAVGYCPADTDNNHNTAPSNTANWTCNYFPGTTTICLDATTNLKVGNPLILDQTDDVNDAGGVMVNQSNSSSGWTPTLTGVSGPYSLEGNGGNAQRSGRSQLQIVTVTRCDGISTPGHICASGASVGIYPGIIGFNWRASQSPGAWWATSPAIAAGLENLKIDCIGIGTNASAPCVMFKNHVGSWMTGVSIKDSSRAGVQIYISTNVTIENNYFWHTYNGVTTSYGAECFTCSSSKIANNIFQAIAGPMLLNGATAGNAWLYNSCFNDYYIKNAGWNQPANSAHSAGNMYDLIEGNICNIEDNDVFHGTHHFITVFRPFQYGRQLACYAGPDAPSPAPPYPGTVPFAPCTNNFPSSRLSSFSRGYNLLAGVFGQSGTYNTYQSGSNTSIFNLGFGNTEGAVTVLDDPNVATTLFRYGNYDSVNAVVRNNASEVPTGLTNSAQEFFVNAVPNSTNFPPSFYYTSGRPAYWVSSKPWPAIGPDVTGGNLTTYGTLGGHVNATPSYDCAVNVMGIPADGTGDIKAFNPSLCYSSSNPPVPPAPASGLFATISKIDLNKLTLKDVTHENDFALNSCRMFGLRDMRCPKPKYFQTTDLKRRDRPFHHDQLATQLLRR